MSRAGDPADGKKTGETTERCVEHDDERDITWDDRGRLNRIRPDGLRLAVRLRAGAARGRDGRHGAERVSATASAVRAMIPVIRRKFHQTQRAILAELKTSLQTTDARSGQVVDP
jgi:hypothetical protein